MPYTNDKSPKWRRVALSTNGNVIAVRYNDISAADLTNLFFAALEKVPHAPVAMNLALEKYNKKNSHEQ